MKVEKITNQYEQYEQFVMQLDEIPLSDGTDASEPSESELIQSLQACGSVVSAELVILLSDGLNLVAKHCKNKQTEQSIKDTLAFLSSISEVIT